MEAGAPAGASLWLREDGLRAAAHAALAHPIVAGRLRAPCWPQSRRPSGSRSMGSRAIRGCVRAPIAGSRPRVSAIMPPTPGSRSRSREAGLGLLDRSRLRRRRWAGGRRGLDADPPPALQGVLLRAAAVALLAPTSCGARRALEPRRQSGAVALRSGAAWSGACCLHQSRPR